MYIILRGPPPQYNIHGVLDVDREKGNRRHRNMKTPTSDTVRSGLTKATASSKQNATRNLSRDYEKHSHLRQSSKQSMVHVYIVL